MSYLLGGLHQLGYDRMLEPHPLILHARVDAMSKVRSKERGPRLNFEPYGRVTVLLAYRSQLVVA